MNALESRRKSVVKTVIQSVACFVSVCLLSGCYTTGLSLREQGNCNYSNFIYGLYSDPPSNAEIKKMNFPLRLAVTQVGENSPPKTMIKKLEENPQLISRVVVLPTPQEFQAVSYPNYNDNTQNNSKEKNDFPERMAQMRHLAQDMNCDYIFLFGGSMDMGETQSWIGFFDITLLGAFVVPSHTISSEGKAVGALIDVSSGKVVFMVNSDSKRTDLTTTASLDGRQSEVGILLRDQLIASLGEEFIQKVSLNR